MVAITIPGPPWIKTVSGEYWRSSHGGAQVVTVDRVISSGGQKLTPLVWRVRT